MGTNPEQGDDEGGLAAHVIGGNAGNLSFADHGHDLVAGDRSARGVEAFKAETGMDQPLDPSVILFNDVVQVFGLAKRHSAPSFSMALVALG